MGNFNLIHNVSFFIKSLPDHDSLKLNFSKRILNCSIVSRSSSSENLKPIEWVPYSEDTTIPSEKISPIRVSLSGRLSDLTRMIWIDFFGSFSYFTSSLVRSNLSNSNGFWIRVFGVRSGIWF